ncbi:MAG: hypothetical protein ACK46X_09575 [Candidatus Sericytochromatia bacterium]
MQGILTRLALAAAASLPFVAAAPAVAAPAPKLDVQHISRYVDFVQVLPGERFPLRATDNVGRTVNAIWRANGGRLAFGDDLAVWQAPLKPGSHRITATALVAGKQLSRTIHMVVTVPVANVRNGKLNGYPIGSYPKGFGAGTSMVANRGVRNSYDVPLGFVELTKATLDVPVSEHYKLRDFAGKDAFVGGKKYLFVEPKLVEKLERLIDSMQSSGYACSKLELMSAYRSPWLNAAIGNQTSLSRHTYGDAADMIVSDFNRDGRADKADATILWKTVDKLDKETALTGGAGWYNPTGGHGYFIHTDTRGSAVRW